MLGLFFGGRTFQSSFGNLWGNIELDAMLEEEHEWSAEVTQNPVEEGAPVSDHVIEKSDKLRIRGFITDSPIVASQSISGTFNLASVDNRTQGVFDLLHELLKLKEPITVYTKHRIYDNMILSSVNIPRNPSIGEAIEFNAEFINIRKVSTKTVEIPKGISAKKEAKAGGKDGSVSKKTEPQKDAGKKQATTVTKPSSALRSLIS